MTDLKDHLTEEQNKDIKKLTKRQILRLTGYTKRLLNTVCVDCKQVIYTNPKTFEFKMLCDDCKQNEIILTIFSGIQDIYKEIKND